MALGTRTQLPSVQLDAVQEDLHDATQATILSGSVAPFALADGQTLTVDVDGGGAQLITFNAVDFDDISIATAAEVVATIGAALTGAIATDDGGAIRLTSDAFGGVSSIEVTGGTANAVLAFPAGVEAGKDATDAVRLINRIPEPGERGVSSGDDIQVEVHDTAGGATLATMEVYVEGTLAYDGFGTGFQSGFAGSTLVFDANTLRVIINPDTDFPSDEEVVVRVTAKSPPASAALDETYSFFTSDLTAPTVSSATAQDKKIIRVTFDEPMLMASPLGATDALNPANYAFTRNDSPSVDVVAVEVLPVSDRAVDVETDIELSFGLSYTVQAIQIADLFGNLTSSPLDSADFISFTPDSPPGRSFQLIDFIPQINKTEDATGDLSAYIAIQQDVTDLLLCEIDRFTDILDPDLAPAQYLDAMLCDLGNPFLFAELSEADKRRLIRILVDIYKSKGTEQGIIDVINFFLGVLVTIESFNGEGWELAASDSPTLDGQSPPAGPGDELSSAETEPADAASLGPGEQRLLYSFIVISPVDLTEEQRDRIEQIVDLMKPAHTHLISIQEPATAPTPADHLELGISELGNGSPGTWTLH